MINAAYVTQGQALMAGLFLAMSASASAQGLVTGWENPYLEPTMERGCRANALTLSECEGRRAEHSGQYLATLSARIAKEVSAYARSSSSFENASALWLKFRDASCEFDASGAAGNSRGYRYAACVHSYNKSRIALLSQYHYCITGGNCPNDLQLYYLVWEPGT